MCPAVPTTIDFMSKSIYHGGHKGRTPRTRCTLDASSATCPLCLCDSVARSVSVSLPPSRLALRAFALAGTLLTPPLPVLRRRLAPPRTALSFADALENLDEPEIDLSHFHVDAQHLDLHLVAEPVDLP